MKFISTIITALIITFSLQNSFSAATDAKWVEISPSKSLYVEYHAPQRNQETVVLLHGLTYSTVQWSKFIRSLTKRGIGVVAYDMEGMGQTLLKYAPVKAIIPIGGQITDLNILLRKLKIKKPYNLIGLSYGGGVAFGYAVKYPQEVKNLILMAPYIKPLKKVDDYLKSQVDTTRKLYPFNPYTDEQLYEFFFRQFVYSVYPMQEPIVLENPYKLEAVFRLSQGVGSFIPEEHVSELNVKAHMLIPMNDQYFPPAEYENFWNLFPKHTQANLFYVKGSEHKIPESQPEQAADFVQKILQ